MSARPRNANSIRTIAERRRKAGHRPLLEGLEDRRLMAFDALRGGLSTLFGSLQPLVNDQVTKLPIPLIGDKFSTAATAQVFASFGSDVLGVVPPTLGDRDAVKDAIQAALNVTATEGPGGSFQFTVSGSAPLGAFDFKLGLDFMDLNAAAMAKVDATLGYDLAMTILVDDNKVQFVPTAADELNLHLTIDTANLSADADFGLLKAKIKPGPGSTKAQLDLLVDVPGTAPIDAANFGSITLAPKLDGTLSASINVAANFLGFDGNDPKPGFNPTLSSDFKFDWNFTKDAYKTSEPLLPKGSLTAKFTDVRLDLGSAVKALIKPVAEQIDRFGGGFLRVAEAIDKPIPALEKVGANHVSILGMIEGVAVATGNADVSDAARVLRQFAFLANLAGKARDVAATGSIYLGEFTLAGGGFDPQAPGAKLSNLNIAAAPQIKNAGALGEAEAKVGLLAELNQNNVHLPILEDPAQAFKLLAGQKDANLVTYEGKFRSEIKKEILNFSFAVGPIPIQVTADLIARFSADFVIGYDASGILGDSRNAADGFFLGSPAGTTLLSFTPALDARAGVGNRSVARVGVGLELAATLAADLADGAEKLNFTELEAKLASGCALELSGSIDLSLFGFIEYISGGSLFPPKVKYSQKREDFGSFNIYNFATACNARASSAEAEVIDPRLGRVDPDGTLYLFIGPRASLRADPANPAANPFLDVVDESVSVSGATDGMAGKVPDDGRVLVSGFGLRPQLYEGVKRIVADGGTGKDVIAIDGVSYPAYLEGGDGDDQITASLGSVTILGGSGNDNLTGGIQSDLIDGGIGNDVLSSGVGDDTLLGGQGDDSLDGSATPTGMPAMPPPNNKYLDGGTGNDNLDGGSGDDTLVGGDGDDTLDGGTGSDRLVGGDDADTYLYGSSSGEQEIDGGSGDDEFLYFGSEGRDVVGLGAAQARAVFDRGGVSAALAGIRTVIVISGDGRDEISVGDLTGTSIGEVMIILGLAPAGDGKSDVTPLTPQSPDDEADTVIVSGTLADDEIRVAPVFGRTPELTNGAVRVGGLSAAVLVANADTRDVLDIRGLSGADDIRSSPSSGLSPAIEAEELVRLLFEGGEGNDFLLADATLLGGSGNDVIEPVVGTNLVNGGEGFDILLVTGSEAGETLDLNASTPVLAINRTVGAVVQSSANIVEAIERIDIRGLGGDDVIRLTALSIPTFVDAGSGNDTINGSAVTLTTLHLIGGDGDDTITGGSLGDRLDGDWGDDSLVGGPGADRMFGGDGFDRFVWNNGDGSDLIEGGSGQNGLTVNGSLTAGDSFVVSANGARVRFERVNLGAFILDLGEVQQLDLALGGGGDLVDVRDLSGTAMVVANVDLGAGDGAQDIVTVEGRTLADSIAIGVDGSAVTLDGTSTRMRLTSMLAANDVLQVRGNAGDDLIEAADGVSGMIAMQLEGNTGRDTIIGDATILGGTGDDTLTGGAGGNIVLGGAGDDVIAGLDGDDTLLGDASATGVGATFAIVAATSGQGDDAIDGGLGADILNGDLGDDSLTGSDGSDTIGVATVMGVAFAEDGNDTIDAGLGNDTVLAGLGNDTVEAGAGDDTAIGDLGNDVILGSDGADLILGTDGDDVIRSGAGNDNVDGGFGDDDIDAGTGDDTVFGGIGNDSILGGDGLDLLFGTDGDDVIAGGLAADVIVGDAGNDTLSGDAGDDEVDGGIGNDSILGGDGLDNLLGGDGDDVISAGADNDTVLGGLGNDTIFGNDGPDTLFGGAGDDAMDGGDGTDLVRGEDGDDMLLGGIGNDTVVGDAGDDSLVGGLGDDTLQGDAGADLIVGDAGIDSLFGGDGNDSLSGGDGTDFLVGNGNSIANGGDDDVLAGDAGDDTLDGGFGDDNLLGGDGADTLLGDAAFLLPNSFQPAILAIAVGRDTLDGGAGNDTLNGGHGNDLLRGNDGDDVLGPTFYLSTAFTEDGNDTLQGGDGADTLNGAVGNDVVSGDAGTDILQGADGDDILSGGSENDSLSGGLGNDLISGDSGDDLLQGDSGADTLNGNAGNDVIDGGDGADILSGGEGNDILTGAEGNDSLSGDSGDDVTLGQAGDDAIDGGDGSDQLWGGIGNDAINGASGDDLAIGGDGDDTLRGSLGNDVILAGLGNDLVYGGFGDDSLFGNDGDDRIFGGDGVPANVPHVRAPRAPDDGNDLLSGGAGRDAIDGGNGSNLLDAGNDGLREVVVAGPGNDVGFAHCERRDATSDRFGIDGGTNRVYVTGGLIDPAEPAETTSRVAVTIEIPRPKGEFVYRPGDPEKRHADPLPRKFRPKLPSKVTVQKGPAPFAGRALSARRQGGKR